MPSFRPQRGQTTTEYALITAVITVALVSAAYSFAPVVASGVRTLAQDVSEVLATHELAGTGAGLPRVGPHGAVGPSSHFTSPAFPGMQSGGTHMMENAEGVWVTAQQAVDDPSTMPEDTYVAYTRDGVPYFASRWVVTGDGTRIYVNEDGTL